MCPRAPGRRTVRTVNDVKLGAPPPHKYGYMFILMVVERGFNILKVVGRGFNIIIINWRPTTVSMNTKRKVVGRRA